MSMTAFRKLVRENPNLDFLLKHSVGNFSVLLDDPNPRVSGFIRLDNLDIVNLFQVLKYEKNRPITKPHLSFLAREAAMGRFLPTNTIVLVEDDDRSIKRVNANHTGIIIQQSLSDGVDPIGSAFSWVLWLRQPECDLVGKVYRTCDSNKPRTKNDKMRSLEVADRLGISETQATRFDNAISVILGDGRNSSTGKAALIAKSHDERLELMFSYKTDFLRYWQSVSLAESKIPRALLKESAVTAAFLVSHKNYPVSGYVGDFMDSLATKEFAPETPQSALFDFYTIHARGKGGSKYRVLFDATLFSIRAYLNDKNIRVGTLRKLIDGDSQRRMKSSSHRLLENAS